MLPDQIPASAMHIRFLVARYEAEQASLRQTLEERIAERERIERRAAAEAITGDPSILRHHSSVLDRECDDLATELLHVRLALLGAREELVRSQQNLARPIADDTGIKPPMHNSSPCLGEIFTDREELLGA